jgi:hypothetical protein
MVSIVGGIFVVLILACLMLRRELLPWVLSAAFPLLATAALVVAGQSILPYYVVAIAIIVSRLVPVRVKDLLQIDLAARVGLRSLLAFGVWTLIVTIAGPLLFAGVPVLNPREGIDQGVAEPALLAPQISNFAQSAYLIFGICVVVTLGSTRTFPAWIPAVGFTIGTSLSSLRSLLPEGVQRDVFDNSTGVAYTAGVVNGVERMRGIFSEPSSLGAFSVTAAVFYVMTASRTTGWSRYFSLVMSAWALINAALSGSGTALVGGLALLAVITAQAGQRFFSGESKLSASALVVSVLAIPVGIVVGPALYAAATAMVDDKVDSSSYANRSSADLFSLDLSMYTYGFGVGVGSNRPSSFFPMLLSCTGVLGTALFLVALVSLLSGALRNRDFHPTAWALTSLVFSKLVAGPDLSDPTMWFLLAVCASAAWHGPQTSDECRPPAVEKVIRNWYSSSSPVTATQSIRRYACTSRCACGGNVNDCATVVLRPILDRSGFPTAEQCQQVPRP